MRKPATTVVPLWLALLLTSCQVVLGDFEIDDGRHDAAVASNESGCRAGAFRCNGEFLLRCGGSGWELANTCATPEMCDGRNGRCAPCNDGELRCNGAHREACKSDGSEWQPIPGPEGDCGSAELCNPGFCGACPVDGALQCSARSDDDSQATATALQRCESGGWRVLDECASEQLCRRSAERALEDQGASASGACDAPPCDAGEIACNDATLRRCPQSRDRWVTVDVCASQAVCKATAADATDTEIAATLESCPPGCAPAHGYFCDGQDLEQCSGDQTEFEHVQTCPDGTTCDVSAGECRGPCSPGARRCNQAILEECDSEATWSKVEKCKSAGLCKVEEDDDTGKWSGECIDPPDGCTDPNVFKCEGAQLFQCTSQQTTWELRGDCFHRDLCDAPSGRCIRPVCSEAAALRCNPAAPLQLQRCRENLTGWDDVDTPCPDGTACNADPELGPVCMDECPESIDRCLGSDRQTCSDDSGQPVWTTAATCATSALCACTLNDTCLSGVGDGGCGVPVCDGLRPDYHCDGTTLQDCAEGRNGWATLQACGADGGASLCFTQYVSMNGVETVDAGRCLACPVALERRCLDSSLRECTSDRSQWHTVTASCAFGCLNDTDQDYCAACLPNERRCMSNDQLHECAANQKSLLPIDDCEHGCLDLGTLDECAFCSASEARCTGPSEVSYCDSDRRGLHTTNESSCDPNGCIEDGLSDRCGKCKEGQRQCNADKLLTCGSNGEWGSSFDCDLACIDDGVQDHCAPDCVPDRAECVLEDGVPTGLRTCENDGTWSSPQSCAHSCIDQGNSDFCAPDCQPGTRRCEGGQSTTAYQVCGSDGMWDAAITCAATTPVCKNGGLCGCNQDADCPDDAPVCESNACVKCKNGTLRCKNSGDLERCSSNDWGADSSCDNSCDPDVEPPVCGDCVNNDYECNADDNYERCVKGAWSLEDDCTEAQTCDAQVGCVPIPT